MLHVNAYMSKVVVGEREGTGLPAKGAWQNHYVHSSSTVQVHKLRMPRTAILWQAYRNIWR